MNGVRLHYVEAGHGPVVVLLHGFPQCWYAWRHQIPALVSAGYRVVAPDLRGYDGSDRPRGIPAYRMEVVAADVAALIRHVEGAGSAAERATVVGHDWGGIAATYVAARHPEVVGRIVLLNAPHPSAFVREVRKPSQALKSWYVLFFQLPWLPEAVLRAGDFAAIRRMFENDASHPGRFDDTDRAQFVGALRPRGALTAALNYYRAALRRWSPVTAAGLPTITAPVLVLWGERERVLNRSLTRGLERWMPRVRLQVVPRASHWIQHDAPERVSELLIQFLREDRGA